MKRVYHTWDKWECYPAGFYETTPPNGMSAREAELTYRELLRDLPRFEEALQRVITEWPNSCEHYLTNENMNRVAWLGQASLCIALGIPSCFRGGFNLLAPAEQHFANVAALGALNRWLKARDEPTLTLEESGSKLRVELY